MQQITERTKRPRNNNLRTRVALGVGLAMFILMFPVVAGHYGHERRVLADQVKIMMVQLGDIMQGNLRHAFLEMDFEMVSEMVEDVGRLPNVERVQLISYKHRLIASSDDTSLEQLLIGGEKEAVECVTCHSTSGDLDYPSADLPGPGELVRFAVPIKKDPGCAECHTQEAEVLGVVLMDASMQEIDASALRAFWVNLLASIIIVAIVVTLIFLLIDRLILRRVEAYHEPLAALGAGDLSVRLPVIEKTPDELHSLATSFNEMMDRLEANIRRIQELQDVRESAIVSERERIARELHDGIAQVLTFISTKTRAARLMIEQDSHQSAIDHLQRLEEASQDLFIEVRQAIMGLKLASQIGGGFENTLREFAIQFNRLSDVPVEVKISPQLSALALDSDTELHLLRIAQEAVANSRKHAGATEIWLHLAPNDGRLEMVIGDNGVGFDYGRQSNNGRMHFGLQTMKERAAAIGADLLINSRKGSGTRVVVVLPCCEEDAQCAS